MNRAVHAEVAYHGTDGLGDAFNADDKPTQEPIREEHAVMSLVRLANQYRGALEVICLAPLTNVALAIRMDAQFCGNLKHCYIMGGNYKGTEETSSLLCKRLNYV